MSDFVFVSPGFKSKEIDLTTAAAALGKTSLGLVGETLKGPAFENILFQSPEEFRVRMGGYSTEKIGGKLKYQLPFVANSFLSESNQLYVTRVLGLSGYDAGPAWVIYAESTEMNVGMGDNTTSNKFTAGGVPVIMNSNNNQILAVIRSRGSYNGVSTSVTFDAKEVNFAMSPTDLFGTFRLDVTMQDNSTESFIVSLNKNSSNYIVKVLGDRPKGKSTPIYVESIFPSIINKLNAISTRQGTSPTVKAKVKGIRKLTHSSVTDYKTQYKTPETPWIVSEIRGSEIERLFKFISISDGTSANEEIKYSITNINPETREFDVLIRDFYDTDDNVKVLESFPRCTMNKDLPSFIGKRIGTSDGSMPLVSNYAMVEVNEQASMDAFPCGFEGYNVRNTLSSDFPDNTLPPSPIYKQSYNDGIDKVNRTYLGISDKVGIDQNLFNYFGTLDSTVIKTAGFHLDEDATGATINTPYGKNGLVGFFNVGKGKLKTVADTFGPNAVYDSREKRKFTLVPAGGFDGWDEHQNRRTNTSIYKKNGLLYPGSDTSDYYAWMAALDTFRNPEEVLINVFATPGINFEEHESLVSEAIDMIERDRADSVYIIDAPDYDGQFFVENVVSSLNATAIDSNYSATYSPWIEMRDPENATNVWLPPTCEVVRNIAYTDNIKFPWFAVGGVNRGVTKANKARRKLSEKQKGELYSNRVNPMATFPSVGVAIWGNKTLQVRDSLLNRLSTRRLLLEIRKLISNVSIRLVFEQNDQQVRDEFLAKITPILNNIKRERGLYDFKIVLDNSAESIDRHELLGKVLLKVVPSLEFIGMNFVLTPTGASFDDI